jgi:hypothetical protein
MVANFGATAAAKRAPARPCVWPESLNQNGLLLACCRPAPGTPFPATQPTRIYKQPLAWCSAESWRCIPAAAPGVLHRSLSPPLCDPGGSPPQGCIAAALVDHFLLLPLSLNLTLPFLALLLITFLVPARVAPQNDRLPVLRRLELSQCLRLQ